MMNIQVRHYGGIASWQTSKTLLIAEIEILGSLFSFFEQSDHFPTTGRAGAGENTFLGIAL
jgi:hypothetical protein